MSIQKSSDWDMKFKVGQETQNSSLATRNTTFSSIHNLCSLSETYHSYGWAIAVSSPLFQIILALPPHKQRGCAGVFQGFFLMHGSAKPSPQQKPRVHRYWIFSSWPLTRADPQIDPMSYTHRAAPSPLLTNSNGFGDIVRAQPSPLSIPVHERYCHDGVLT